MKQLMRSWQAAWRDTLILLNEFRLPLILFNLVIIGGGLYYRLLATQVGQ